MKKYNVRITEYYRIDGIEAESLEEAERIALMMDWVKTARLLNSIDHEDSWIDKAGYTALGGEFSQNDKK